MTNLDELAKIILKKSDALRNEASTLDKLSENKIKKEDVITILDFLTELLPLLLKYLKK